MLAELGQAIERAQALVQRPPDDVIRSLRNRYEMGESLYKREYLTWDEDRFIEEAMCELADLFLYLAMQRVVHPLAGGR